MEQVDHSTPNFSVPKKIYFNFSTDEITTTAPEDKHAVFVYKDHVSGLLSVKELFPSSDITLHEELNSFAKIMQSAAEVAKIHTYYSRINENHPAHKGLKPTQINELRVNRNDWLARGDTRYRHEYDVILKNFTNILELGLTLDSIGWVNPNTPLEFGSLYLYPTEDVQEREKYGWALAQHGIKGMVGYAQWDNATLIESFIQRILHESVETSLAIRALVDAETISEAVSKKEEQENISEALNIFTNRPFPLRTVSTVMQDTARSLSLPLQSSKPMRGGQSRGLYIMFPWSQEIDADNSSISISYFAEKVWSGYVGVFETALTKPDFEKYVNTALKGLKDIPHVAVLTEPNNYQKIWVTVDVTNFLKYGELYELPENLQKQEDSQSNV